MSSFDVTPASNIWREAAKAEERLKLIRGLRIKGVGFNQCNSYAEKLSNSLKCEESQRDNVKNELVDVMMTTKEKDAKSEVKRLRREKQRMKRMIRVNLGGNSNAIKKFEEHSKK